METAGSAETPHTVDEVKQLKACIDDLIGFVTLPATWSGCATSDIVGTLPDALLRVLALHLAYVRWRASIDMTHFEMFRVAGSRHATTRPEAIGEAFSGWLAHGPQAWPSRVPNPLGSGDV